MERVQLALRRYQQILPQPPTAWEDFPVRRVLVWLRDDVCAVLEDYCNRPAFREQATWPLRALVPGAVGPERRLVDAVDAGLVEEAHALLALAQPKRVRRELAALNPPQEVVTEEAFDL